jgi:low temperature requirement protein LtrA
MSDPAPRLVAQTGRTVAWYELFFDLVFVVVVAISAHLIEVDTSVQTVLAFVLLFFPLWWAWVNLSVTSNLFGQRYRAIGVLLIVAMPGPAAMAIAISAGIADYAWLYAAGAAWIRLVLLVMWLLPYRSNATRLARWRPFAYNLGTAAIWLASIAVPQPWQFLVWGAAVVVEVVLLAARSRNDNSIYSHASIGHALERLGLLVVIVIGEAVYLSVTGLAEHPTLPGGAAALFGLVICALLARAFFAAGAPSAEAGLVAAQSKGSFGVMRDVIMYFPFLIVTGLTLIAAAIGIAVAHGEAPLELDARVVLAVGVAAFYAANAFVGLRLRRPLGPLLTLAIPGLLLPAVACLLTGSLPGWATLASVALAVLLLDRIGWYLGRRPRPDR